MAWGGFRSLDLLVEKSSRCIVSRFLRLLGVCLCKARSGIPFFRRICGAEVCVFLDTPADLPEVL